MQPSAPRRLVKDCSATFELYHFVTRPNELRLSSFADHLLSGASQQAMEFIRNVDISDASTLCSSKCFDIVVEIIEQPPVLDAVLSWLKTGSSSKPRTPEDRESIATLCFDRLLVLAKKFSDLETMIQILRYRDRNDSPTVVASLITSAFFSKLDTEPPARLKRFATDCAKLGFTFDSRVYPHLFRYVESFQLEVKPTAPEPLLCALESLTALRVSNQPVYWFFDPLNFEILEMLLQRCGRHAETRQKLVTTLNAELTGYAGTETPFPDIDFSKLFRLLDNTRFSSHVEAQTLLSILETLRAGEDLIRGGDVSLTDLLRLKPKISPRRI